MTHNPATGAREFVVPFGGIPEGGHFHAPAELLLEVGPRRRVAVRYFPSNQEFQLRLFDLVKGTTFADQAAQISMDCSQGAQPVVTFEADPPARAARTRRNPGSLSNGVPASDTNAMRSPACMRATSASACAASLCWCSACIGRSMPKCASS